MHHITIVWKADIGYALACLRGIGDEHEQQVHANNTNKQSAAGKLLFIEKKLERKNLCKHVL